MGDVETMSTLTTGVVKDEGTTHRVEVKPIREVEEYKGEPPTNDGRNAIRWTLKGEKCSVKYEGKKCEQKLIVDRVMKATYQKDESGFGGQLDYDEKDVKYFKFCPNHGPFPVDGGKWG